MSFYSVTLKLVSKESCFSIQKQDHMSLLLQALAAFWAKQTENLEEKKKRSEPALGPFTFLF